MPTTVTEQVDLIPEIGEKLKRVRKQKKATGQVIIAEAGGTTQVVTEAQKVEMRHKIDELLRLRTELKNLGDQEEILKKEITKFMASVKAEIIRTEKTEAKMCGGTRRTVSPKTYYEKVGLEKFLDSVKVELKKAAQHLAESELDVIAKKSKYSFVRVGALVPDSAKILYL